MNNKLEEKMDEQKAGRKDKHILPHHFFSEFGIPCITLFYRKTASYMVWHLTDLVYNVKL